jgi:hypothetical protein
MVLSGVYILHAALLMPTGSVRATVPVISFPKPVPVLPNVAESSTLYIDVTAFYKLQVKVCHITESHHRRHGISSRKIA